MNTQIDKDFALEMLLSGAWDAQMAREYLASNEYKCNDVEIVAEVVEVEVSGELKAVAHDIESARQYASRRANLSNGNYSHAVFERYFVERLKWLGYSRYDDAVDSHVIAILERSKAKEQRKHG